MRGKAIDFSELSECDVIVDEVMSRFKKGLGTNILIIGLSGTGKSSVSLRLTELIQEAHKELEREIEVKLTDNLINLIEDVRGSSLGDCEVIEEVSVLFPSRRSMGSENVAVNKLFDTVRKKQLVLIANAPILGTIDSHMRSMGHIIIETLRIYKTQKVVVSKTLKMQTNPRSGKTYFHRFQRKGREVHRVFTRMPNSETWKEYEKDKDRFMDELYNNLKHDQEVKKQKRNKEISKLSDRTTITEPTTAELRAHQLVRIEGKSLRDAAKKMGYKAHTSVKLLLDKLDNKTRIFQKPDNVLNHNEAP